MIYAIIFGVSVGLLCVVVLYFWLCCMGVRDILRARRARRELKEAKQSAESAALAEAASRERQRAVNLGHG